MDTVFVLHVLTSDQYGTYDTGGIFSTKELADAAAKKFNKTLTAVSENRLDEINKDLLRRWS
jgi:hypothetical protein